ncbi:MAG: TfuA-related McrA-glycine thioamidation protein [Methanomassiliicoccales archaeon]|nr:TfuA-related McrA-glycine thioamidation protein [Methanomassiliicoccales archaeon]
MTRPVVFLGPSLSLDEARKVLDADYRPPVKRGDLGQLEDVKIVGIIDGVFLQSCAVGHREILALLRKGVTVIGGGSMGALRATEMHDYGMVGVGQIFDMYSQGEIEGDDEVALVFDPESLEPLSEPMVNIRFVLNEAVQVKVISTEQKDDLLRKLRSVYYPRRTVRTFLSIAMSTLKGEDTIRFTDFFKDNYRDIKKQDAITVLKSIKKRV